VFPVGLQLAGLPCLVVGTGEEAALRAEALAAVGATVHVVAERPGDALVRGAAAGRFALSARPFADEDLDGKWLAVLTDLDAELADRIERGALARRVFFCAVDQPGFGNFAHLALARSGPLVVAISTNGRAPSLARRLREELARLFAESGMARFVDGLGALRDGTAPAERRRVLGEAVRAVRFTGTLSLPDPDAADQGEAD
jgi:siroheme synthase-like protein